MPEAPLWDCFSRAPRGREVDLRGKAIVADAMAEGLLINCTHEKMLRFLPPYVITDQEIDRAVKILAKIFKKVKYPPTDAAASAPA